MWLFEKWRRDFWPTVVSAAFIAAIVVFVNWEASKTRLGEAMEAVGVDWTNPKQVSDGDKLNFVTAVALAGLAGWVAFLGVKLNRRAHDLAEKQAEQADLERAKRPRLRLYVLDENWMSLKDGSTRWVLQFAIENVGDRDARDVRWEIRVPFPPSPMDVDLAPWTVKSYDSNTEPVVQQALSGVRVVRAAYQGTIYAGQADVSACLLRFNMPSSDRPAMKIGFYLTSAEGRFPSAGSEIIDIETVKVVPKWLQALGIAEG